MLDKQDVAKIIPQVFAPWVQDLSIEVTSIDDNLARFTIPQNDRLVRIGGIVCGQALSAFADTAMVLALCAKFDGFRPVTTVDQTTSFMKPIRNVGVICDVEILRLGRQMAFLRAILYEQGGAPAASASGSYMLPPPDKT